MPYVCRAVTTVRPVAAGVILAIVERGAIDLCAGKNVMPVRAVARAIHHIANFVNRCFLVEVGFVAMQVCDIVSNENTVRIVPGSATNSVFGIGTIRAQVCSPGTRSGTRGFCQCLTMRVGTRQAAEVCTVTRTAAGQEKTHRVVLSDGQTETRGQQQPR